MDDIARKAKVGVGHRLPPLPHQGGADPGAHGRSASSRSPTFVEAGLDDPDPWNGFVQSLWRGAELGANDRGITALFSDRVAQLVEVQAATTRLNAAAAELIRRAQAAGTMRPDVTVDDVPVLHVRDHAGDAPVRPRPGRVAAPPPARAGRVAGGAAHDARSPLAASLRGVTAPPLSDPELEQVAWDLIDLLEGADQDPAGRRRRHARPSARERAEAFAERYRGKLASLDGDGPRRRHARARRARGDDRPRVLLRGAELLHRHRRPGSRRAAAARAGAGARRSGRCSCSGSSSGRRSTTSAPRRCSPPRGWTSARHHLRSARRYRPHLLSEPEEKLMSEKARDRAQRLGPPVRGADLGDPRHAARTPTSRSRSRSRSRGCRRRTATTRATAAAAVTEALEPGLRTRAYIFNTLLADKALDDRLRSYPTLDLGAQPRQRGVRRVRPGARHRRPQPLRAAAPLVPAQGAAARAGPPEGLRPHGRGVRRRGDRALERGPRDRAGVLRRASPATSASSCGASSTSPGSTRRVRPGTSAAAPSARTRCRPCTRTCCSTTRPSAATC